MTAEGTKTIWIGFSKGMKEEEEKAQAGIRLQDSTCLGSLRPSKGLHSHIQTLDQHPPATLVLRGQGLVDVLQPLLWSQSRTRL